MGETLKQRHYSIALKAVEHARAAIPHGVTRLENNHLPAPEDAELVARVEASKVEIRAQRDAYLASTYWVDPTIAFFESRIIFHRQFKVGECKELCIVALDFIARKFPQAHAEIFQIAGEEGDHGFIAIGRAEDSDPQNPATWGEDAYILDPWMNRVFPANEYQGNLVNYFSYFKEGDSREYNGIEPFDPDRHTLEPEANMTTQHLREMNSTVNLNRQYEHFRTKITSLETALLAYKRILDSLKGKLSGGILIDSKKIHVIDLKITQINSLLEDDLFSLPETHNYRDYRDMGSRLHPAIAQLSASISQSCKFSEDDMQVIKQGSGGLVGLFARRSDTARQVGSIEFALETLDLSLKARPTSVSVTAVVAP